MPKKKFDQSQYFSKTELLTDRKWTEKLVEELLPEPVIRYIPYVGKAKFWVKEDVLMMEQSAEFFHTVQLKEDRKKKREKAQQQLIHDMQDGLQNTWSVSGGVSETRQKVLVVEYLHQAVLYGVSLPSNHAPTKEATVKNISDTLQFLYEHQPTKDKECIAVLERILWVASALYKKKEKTRATLLNDFFVIYRSLLENCAEVFLESIYKHVDEKQVSGFLYMDPFPTKKLLKNSLYQIYMADYLPYMIERDLSSLMEVDPKDEYPAARSMNRKFIIHVGPTNSGKTYQSLQRLMAAESGVYLGPLRLLALETQDRMTENGVPCSLLTGEEEDLVAGAKHIASTVEKADLQTHYAVAVIDECQLIYDRSRGFAWTRAILGIQADEIHCCVAPEGLEILKKLITSCGDTYTIESLKRFTPLCFENRPVIGTKQLQRGDAIVAFSKKEVLFLADMLANAGKPASVIYGKLPYPARKKQVERFLKGETQYVVATDAIGMGMNLPIRRVLFFDVRKFDGEIRRNLRPEEVRQIAGRAGRKGLYEDGFCSVFTPYQEEFNYYEIEFLKELYHEEIVQVPVAYLGFSDLVLRVDHDLLSVLKVWANMKISSPLYQKMDISRYIKIISNLRGEHIKFDKKDELAAANVPFDEESEALWEQFLGACRNHERGLPPEKPQRRGQFLDDLELYCKRVDLYYSCSKAFGYPADLEWIRTEKDRASEQINRKLIMMEQRRQEKKRKKTTNYRPKNKKRR